MSLQEEFPGVAGVPETVVLVTGILSKAPAVGDFVLLVLLCFLLKSCFGFRADLKRYSSEENPPTFSALPAQPELLVWGRGASRRVLSLVSVWGVCVRTGLAVPGYIAAIFIGLCQESLALAVRISAGFMGGWERWQEKLQAWKEAEPMLG